LHQTEKNPDNLWITDSTKALRRQTETRGGSGLIFQGLGRAQASYFGFVLLGLEKLTKYVGPNTGSSSSLTT
jgi:hypothetical protein